MRVLSKILKIRLFFLVLFSLVVLFLGNEWLSPSGTWSCRHAFSLNKIGSTCLGDPFPSERYALSPDGSLLVLADPLYFSVFSPRPFQKIEVEIVYRPHLSESQAIFEAGFLADSKLWRYQLKPVYNLYLEKYINNWQVVHQDNLYLFQKEMTYKTVSDFLKSWQDKGQDICNQSKCLALYNISDLELPKIKYLSNLEAYNTEQIFPYQLRGAHQFYFYLTDSNLEFKASFFDLNENKDKDDLEIILLKDSKQIEVWKISDNRDQKETSDDLSVDQSISINKEGLEKGLYRFDLRGSDDLIFKDIQINSQYLSFINKIWPVGNEPVNLFSDAGYLQLKSLSPASFQKIIFDDKEINLNLIYRQYELRGSKENIHKISLEKGGIILENHGVFSSNISSLLNPDYSRLDRFTFNNDQIDFILANYQAAEVLENDWRRSVLNFDSAGFYREDGRYNLILSIPGLRFDSGSGGLVEIKEINLRYLGPSLFDKLKDMFFT